MSVFRPFPSPTRTHSETRCALNAQQKDLSKEHRARLWGFLVCENRAQSRKHPYYPHAGANSKTVWTCTFSLRSSLSTNAIKDTVSVLYWYEELSSKSWRIFGKKIFGSLLFFFFCAFLCLRTASFFCAHSSPHARAVSIWASGKKFWGVRHSGFPSHH